MTPRGFADARQVAVCLGVIAAIALSSPADDQGDSPDGSAPEVVVHDDAIEVKDLGAGHVAFHLFGTQLVGDTYFAVSRRISPAILVGYDLGTQSLRINQEIKLEGVPPSVGGRAMAAIGNDLYIAMGFEDQQMRLLRVDTVSGAVTEVAKPFPDIRMIWHMDASPDGLLYMATSRHTEGRVYEYNPQTDELRDLGPFETHPRQGARSVVATADTIYVGMGYNRIDLWAFDRATGDRTSILPAELDTEHWLYALDANERWVVAGTGGSNPKLAVIDRNDYTSYRIVAYDHGTIQALRLVDDVVYFGHGGHLWRYEIENDKAEPFVSFAHSRGLFYRDGKLYGGAGGRAVNVLDLETEERTMIDLVDEGANPGAEWAQSIAVGNGTFYYAGRRMGVFDLATGTHKQVAAPGEPKSMVVVDGTLYAASYGGGTIERYDPQREDFETVMPRVGHGQNRPRTLYHEPVHNLLLMGTQADEVGGGALTVFDLNTGEAEALINPLGERAIATITSHEGMVYMAAQRAGGPLAAWDPQSRQWLWKVVPLPNDWVIGMVVRDREIHGISLDGVYFVFDLDSQTLSHQERVLESGGRMVEHEGVIYGTNGDVLFRIDPERRAYRELVSHLNSGWFTWPGLAVDEDGAIYVLAEGNVLQVRINADR